MCVRQCSTIHITPEEGFSYASFEVSCVGDRRIETARLLRQVAAIFEPAGAPHIFHSQLSSGSVEAACSATLTFACARTATAYFAGQCLPRLLQQAPGTCFAPMRQVVMLTRSGDNAESDTRRCASTLRRLEKLR